jgi:hypothetical protein
MPLEKKLDPFKPQEPVIPGVPSTSEKNEKVAHEPPPQFHAPVGVERPAAAESPANAAILGIVLTVAGALLTVGAFFYWSHSSSAKSNLGVSAEAAAPAAAAVEKTQPADKVLVGPGPIATTEELAKPWSARKFLFRGPLTPEAIPALVVRLPGGQLWGFSLREPFGDCNLEYVTDLKKLGTDYGFHAEHPMVVNPCTRAVYDLMRYGGGAPNGGLVRGDIVQGTGVRPPMAIEIRTSGRDVVAVRSE